MTNFHITCKLLTIGFITLMFLNLSTSIFTFLLLGATIRSIEGNITARAYPKVHSTSIPLTYKILHNLIYIERCKKIHTSNASVTFL